MNTIVAGTNLRRYKEAVIDGRAADIFLTPVFKEPECYLWYDSTGRLDERMLPCSKSVLKASGVKPTLKPLPGQKAHFRWTWIVGHLFTVDGQQRFVATGIRVSVPHGDHNAHKLSRPIQMGLLHQRGFSVPLHLCSWLSVIGFKKGIVQTRKLPRKRADLEEQCQTRLKSILAVWNGKRRAYWTSKAPGGKEKTVARVSKPQSLEFAAAAGHANLW